MGGKPVQVVVDSHAVETISDDRATALGPASAPIGFLSAPPDDPVADPVADMTAGETGAADDISDISVNGGASDTRVNGSAVTPGATEENRNNGFAGEPPGYPARHTGVTETLTAGALRPGAGLAAEAYAPPARPAAAVWDASEAVTEIYASHYNSLVRLALLLLHDVQTAEEVVQDAFEAMHLAWRRVRERDKALSYLRQSVVNRSRSVLRHRKVVDLHQPKPAPDEPSAEHAALVLIERSAVISALHLLPERQREAVVLRYYADLSEADIAQAMGISRGAVKSHTARAMAALRSTLGQETP